MEAGVPHLQVLVVGMARVLLQADELYDDVAPDRGLSEDGVQVHEAGADDNAHAGGERLPADGEDDRNGLLSRLPGSDPDHHHRSARARSL